MYCTERNITNIEKNNLCNACQNNHKKHTASSLDKQEKGHFGNKKANKIVIGILFSCWIFITMGLWVYSSDIPTTKSSELRNPPFDDSLILGHVPHQDPTLKKVVSK